MLPQVLVYLRSVAQYRTEISFVVVRSIGPHSSRVDCSPQRNVLLSALHDCPHSRPQSFYHQLQLFEPLRVQTVVDGRFWTSLSQLKVVCCLDSLFVEFGFAVDV